MLHEDCEDARRLLDSYLMALAQQELFRESKIGMANFREFQVACDKSITARWEYWEHVQQHGCHGCLKPYSKPAS